MRLKISINSSQSANESFTFKVGSKLYNDLNSAIQYTNGLSYSTTIAVYKDYVFSSPTNSITPITNDVTISLGSHTVQNTLSSCLIIQNSATVTLSGSGTLRSGSQGYCITISTGSYLNSNSHVTINANAGGIYNEGLIN